MKTLLLRTAFGILNVAYAFPLLMRRILLGYFGRKTGRGSYDYSGAELVAMKQLV